MCSSRAACTAWPQVPAVQAAGQGAAWPASGKTLTSAPPALPASAPPPLRATRADLNRRYSRSTPARRSWWQQKTRP